MKIQIFILPLFLIFTASFAFGQTAHKFMMQANTEYKNKNFAEAEELYRKALEQEYTGKAVYNLGNTIYAQGRYEEAIPKFVDASNMSPNKDAQSSSFHNLGNAYFQNGQLQEAIDAYKDALRSNPSDIDTKYNLARAQNILKQQKEQKQQQEQQDQENKEENKEDQENQDQNQSNENQDQEQNEEKDQNQDQENQEQQGDQEPKPQAGEPQEMSREEAMKLLQIMEQEEQNVQKKMQLRNATPNKSDKDW